LPSEDPIQPEANLWFREAGISQGAAAGVPKTRKPEKRKMSAALQRLALRLGKDPDEMAARIPEDTLRRLKYPVIERKTPDGKREYEHDLGIDSRARSTRG
jgi:hypothetical protein